MKFQFLSDLQSERLLKCRTIDILNEEVEGKLALRIAESLQWLETMGSPDFTINLVSDGGSIVIGFDIYYLLRRYSGKVTCHVPGFVSSAGILILLGCDIRTAVPVATLLVHSVSHRESVPLATFLDEEKLRKITRPLQESHDRKVRIYVERTGQPREVVEKANSKDTSLTAKEALKYGLLTAINPAEE